VFCRLEAGPPNPDRFSREFTRRVDGYQLPGCVSTSACPTACGKVERFQQTLKNWLRARPADTTIDELQALLDEFVDHYNQHRPHASLGRATPTAAYTRLPKTGPATDPKTDYRIRQNRVDNYGKVTLRYNGRLYKIGIGRADAGTAITMLIADRNIRIITTQTGELLRHLELDPTRTYQPTGTGGYQPTGTGGCVSGES
jgi:hypothetical protein